MKSKISSFFNNERIIYIPALDAVAPNAGAPNENPPKPPPAGFIFQRMYVFCLEFVG